MVVLQLPLQLSVRSYSTNMVGKAFSDSDEEFILRFPEIYTVCIFI